MVIQLLKSVTFLHKTGANEETSWNNHNSACKNDPVVGATWRDNFPYRGPAPAPAKTWPERYPIFMGPTRGANDAKTFITGMGTWHLLADGATKRLMLHSFSSPLPLAGWGSKNQKCITPLSANVQITSCRMNQDNCHAQNWPNKSNNPRGLTKMVTAIKCSN